MISAAAKTATRISAFQLHWYTRQWIACSPCQNAWERWLWKGITASKANQWINAFNAKVPQSRKSSSGPFLMRRKYQQHIVMCYDIIKHVFFLSFPFLQNNTTTTTTSWRWAKLIKVFCLFVTGKMPVTYIFSTPDGKRRIHQLRWIDSFLRPPYTWTSFKFGSSTWPYIVSWRKEYARIQKNTFCRHNLFRVTWPYSSTP